jgi:fused signal recognition particle receptor
VKYAQANNCDAVLADTAGRTHVDRDLADELKKIVKVSRPDLKILVIDSLTGNDAVEQARSFDGIVGVDGVVFTKTDVNKKGGSIFSVCYAIKKPVLFLGTGQGYGDMEKFEPRKFVAGLVG